MKKYYLLLLALLMPGFAWAQGIEAFPSSNTVIHSSLSGQSSTTNWGSCGSSACAGGAGGTINIAQHTGLSTPTLTAMSLVATFPASGNNVLWYYKPGSCDTCQYIDYSLDVWVPSGVANYEFDSFIGDQTDNTLAMFGKQCNTTTGFWQYANETSTWTNGPIPCSLTTGIKHHLEFFDWFIPWDKACGGVPCLHFGSINIDGVSYSWGDTVIASTTMTSIGWTAVYGCQVQMDSSASGTVTEYIDNYNCVVGQLNNTKQTFHMDVTGNDSNPGTASKPWASPNHVLRCGDTILANPGSYSASNFANGHWGNNTCPTGDRVAWLRCTTFAACLVHTQSPNFGMNITASYWGIDGWDVSTVNGSSIGWGCFSIQPPGTSGPDVHHIIVEDSVANGCGAGGFTIYNQGTHGVDYVAFISDVAYNAAQGNNNCYSGFSIYQPKMVDSGTDTHFLTANSISYHNIDPNPCAGGAPNGGDGFISDTFDGTQGSGNVYTAKSVWVNNLAVGNANAGFETQTYTPNAGFQLQNYFYNNTSYGNKQGPTAASALCADTLGNIAYGVSYTNSIIVTTAASACGGNPLYGLWLYDGDSSDTTSGNLISVPGAPGAPSGTFNNDTRTGTIGSNNTGDPSFASAGITLTAPSCSGKANVADCMSWLLGAYTAHADLARGLGVQPATNINGSDSLFPQWVCKSNPTLGLTSMSCLQ